MQISKHVPSRHRLTVFNTLIYFIIIHVTEYTHTLNTVAKLKCTEFLNSEYLPLARRFVCNGTTARGRRRLKTSS